MVAGAERKVSHAAVFCNSEWWGYSYDWMFYRPELDLRRIFLGSDHSCDVANYLLQDSVAMDLKYQFLPVSLSWRQVT